MRDPGEIRLSFANAQKMRAAASWNFGQVENQGNVPWRKSEVTEKWTGNPSVSPLVSQYMTSLKRRKAMLERMYDYMHENGRSEVQRLGAVKCRKWEGARARLLTWCAYLIAFHCLLRVDEVLKIQAHDIRIDLEDNEVLIVTLPFRKTHQDGKVEPFYLYPLPEEQAYLCPVRAYAEWICASEISNGYLCPKIGSGDRLITDKKEPMSSADFLEMFRNHLLDVGIDPYPYGTHSFRRGGCQYFHIHRRWLMRDICQWGGWSIEFSSLTIVKYLISSNDEPSRPVQTKCTYCGRSCNCA
ncbi:hypothetical protein B0H12DRAFT_1205029 [Mycena haematopus]|nr:hypothetical protein B0H12DRAFT_1205029 [Mycena haematopus]